MTPIRGSCKTCKHFDLQSNSTDGLCRAHSPQVAVIVMSQKNHLTGQTSMTPVVVANFPQVGAECWCGEWQGGLSLAMND